MKPLSMKPASMRVSSKNSTSRHRWVRVSLPWLGIAVVALAAASLRYLLIEPADVAHLCDAVTRPGWCTARQMVVFGFLGYGYGYAALAAALLALGWKHPLSAWLAAAFGAFALELYCFEAGAFALLLGSLRLLRWQTDRLPPPGQYGSGKRQVAAQP